MGSAQSVEPDQVETCGGNKVSMGFPFLPYSNSQLNIPFVVSAKQSNRTAPRAAQSERKNSISASNVIEAK